MATLKTQLAKRTRSTAQMKLEFPMKRAVRNAKGDVLAAMRQLAKDLQSRIEERAPIDSGRLRAMLSISAITKGKNPRLEITGVHYTRYQERGWRTSTGRTIPGKRFIQAEISDKRRELERTIAENARALQSRRVKPRRRKRR